MLRRHQAAAAIAARRKIVAGGVGMVEMALQQLERDRIVTLHGERKAAMVSNLTVLLCGEHSGPLVLNGGALDN